MAQAPSTAPFLEDTFAPAGDRHRMFDDTSVWTELATNRTRTHASMLRAHGATVVW
ncbi:MAG TPA: hypothetical protein VNG11_05450 [Chloroflexota bacterium]|nr:hypothetical protein [Chloroflexota bacterium]